MGRGWGRAFCTTIPRDREIPSPRKCVRLGFLSGVGGSTPTTPRGQGLFVDSPSLRCKTNTSNQNGDSSNNSNSLKLKSCSKSTPASPRSPFSILKNSFRLQKSSCGVCSQSIKSGQGTAIYTAECGHVFHFPCIATHIKKTEILVCPFCKSPWKNAPFLTFHKAQSKQALNEQETPKLNEHETPKLTTTLPNLKIRAYNDDEPLKSPAGGTGFVAIPEDDDVEEFQGFFANPIRSSSNDCGYVRNVELGLLPEVALVSVGQSHATYVAVLRVKAPPALPAHMPAAEEGHTRRAPIDLVTVLDVSLSMDGAKLQMMKRAMRLVISSLGSADRLSILAFSASPKRLLPLTRMTPQGQRAAKRIIDRLATTSHGSSLAEALSKATKVLEDRRERNPVASIMLLSDGQDEKVKKSNVSNQQRGSSQESSTRFAHMEIPSNSAEDGFAKCVSGLLSVVVQDLRVEIGFGRGSDPGEISAVYSCNGRPTIFDSRSIRLGDLYAEEERELLVELRVPTPVIRSHHVLSVKSSYREPSNQDLIDGPDQALLVPRPQAVSSSTQKNERLRGRFIATRAIAESRRLIEHNEMSSAHQLLASARALLMQSSSESGEEFVRGLEAELVEIQRRRMQMIQRQREVVLTNEDGEPLTPTSAWRAAEQLAKVARMKKSINRVSDLHGFENARF